MKIRKFLPFSFVVVLMLLLVTACDKNKSSIVLSEEAQSICGSWAYIHDKETAIAVFRKDGTAKYKEKSYSFECDSQYITLKDKDGEAMQLRYLFDDKGMYLYSNSTYTFSGEGEPHGLVGVWSNPEEQWSYEFTEAGEFLEDGIFYGSYTVDDKASTFKLVYYDQFEDTVCYFRLEENKLHVEYPWRMFKMGDK